MKNIIPFPTFSITIHYILFNANIVDYNFLYSFRYVESSVFESYKIILFSNDRHLSFVRERGRVKRDSILKNIINYYTVDNETYNDLNLNSVDRERIVYNIH